MAESIVKEKEMCVNVRFYSRHEQRGTTLLLTLKVVIAPFTGGEKIYESPDSSILRGFESQGSEHILLLSPRREDIKVSLDSFYYPKKTCILEEIAKPIQEKRYSVQILSEGYSIESEFNFIFVELEETKLNEFFFKANFTIEHETIKISCEPSFFLRLSNCEHQRLGGGGLKSSNDRDGIYIRNKTNPEATSPTDDHRLEYDIIRRRSGSSMDDRSSMKPLRSDSSDGMRRSEEGRMKYQKSFKRQFGTAEI